MHKEVFSQLELIAKGIKKSLFVYDLGFFLNMEIRFFAFFFRSHIIKIIIDLREDIS